MISLSNLIKFAFIKLNKVINYLSGLKSENQAQTMISPMELVHSQKASPLAEVTFYASFGRLRLRSDSGCSSLHLRSKAFKLEKNVLKTWRLLALDLVGPLLGIDFDDSFRSL